MTEHCWADGPEAYDGMSQTCMLARGHKGPHQWTRDDVILILFPEAPEGEPEVRW